MYLTKIDLTSHIHLENLTEIVRDYKLEFANLTEFPLQGKSGIYYIALDTTLSYQWDGLSYVVVPYVDLIAKAIDDAVQQAKGYLNRFDLSAMFGTDTTAKTYTNSFLEGLIKDIACWKLVKLANPNIDVTIFRSAYQDALKTLDKVQNGMIDPGWPLQANDPATAIDDAGNVEWTASPKRSNHY
jgi:hypothetical protein